MIREIEMAYIAGLMDGDGSFTISKLVGRSANPLYYPLCQLSNCIPGMTSFMKERFGGHVVPSKRKMMKNGKLGSEVLTWKLRSGCNVKPFLERVIPYLKIKRERAELILEFINNFKFVRGQMLDIETLKNRERDYIKMKLLNSEETHFTLSSVRNKTITDDPLKLAYIAGIMETDGSFTIKKQVKNKGTHVVNPRYSPVISLSMVDMRAIRFIVRHVPQGTLCVPKNSGTSRGLHYQFSIGNRKGCVSFINAIIPYLRSKKENASVVRDFCENISVTRYCKAGVSEEELAYRESCYKKIISINNGHRYGVSKPPLIDLEVQKQDDRAERTDDNKTSKSKDMKQVCLTVND